MSRSFLIGLAFVTPILGIVFFFPRESYVADDPAYNQAYWSVQIENAGAARAYQRFVQKNSAESFDRQHLASHVMGELLYKHEGEAGIAVCDASFGFGCYHGFFARALSVGGSESIASLNTACLEAYGPLGTGCLHGIGHGILEYVGYEALPKALDLCKETTQLVPLLGCTSGVFMEYHSPLAGLSDALVPTMRSLSADAPYEPCTNVDVQYHASCYYELGAWYPSAFSNTYEEPMRLCGGLTGSNRHHCYLGLGSSIPPSNGYAVSETLAQCDALTATDALSCRAGASWAFYSNPAHRSSSRLLCGYTDEAIRASCMSFADLTEGLKDTTP